MWRKTPEAKPSSSNAVLGSPDKTSVGREAASESNSVSPAMPAKIQSSQMSTSYLPAGLKLKGTLSGRSDLTIDTQFEGAIELPDSTVRIGPNGRVQCGIAAREIAVQGSVAGNLKAKDSVVLEQGSSVRGNVSSRRLRIDDGASFHGAVDMDQIKESTREASVASVPATPTPSQQLNQNQPAQTQPRTGAPRVVERSVAAKAKAAE